MDKRSFAICALSMLLVGGCAPNDKESLSNQPHELQPWLNSIGPQHVGHTILIAKEKTLKEVIIMVPEEIAPTQQKGIEYTTLRYAYTSGQLYRQCGESYCTPQREQLTYKHPDLPAPDPQEVISAETNAWEDIGLKSDPNVCISPEQLDWLAPWIDESALNKPIVMDNSCYGEPAVMIPVAVEKHTENGYPYRKISLHYSIGIICPSNKEPYCPSSGTREMNIPDIKRANPLKTGHTNTLRNAPVMQ